MTTPKSLKPDATRHSFWVALNTGLPLAVIAAAIFILIIPVQTIHDIGTGQGIQYIFIRNNATNIEEVTVLFGAAMAVLIYSFLARKRATTFYMTLGINRKRLFWSRYTAGLTLVFLPIIVMSLTDLLMNINKLGFQNGMVGSFFYFMLGFCILGFVGYSAGTLACVLSGTIIECIGFSAVLLIGPSVLFLALNQLMKVFLLGNSYGVTMDGGTNADIFTLTHEINPLLFFTGGIEQYTSRTTNGMSLFTQKAVLPVNPTVVLVWGLVALVITAVALQFFLRRRAEVCGQMGCSKLVNYITSFVLGFLVFSMISYTYNSGLDVVLCILLSTLGFIVVFALAHLILRRNFKRLLKDAIGLPVELAIMFLVVISLASGLFGYSNWTPDSKDVKKMTISYLGSPNNTSIVYGFSCGGVYGFSAEITCTTSKDVQTAIGLHRELIANGKKQLHNDEMEKMDKSATIPVGVEVTYYMRDGSKVRRDYDRTSMGVAADFLKLDETDAMRETITALFSKNALVKNISSGGSNIIQNDESIQKGDIYLADRFYTKVKQITLPDRTALLEAIRKDTLAQSLTQRYYPSNQPAAILYFVDNSEGMPSRNELNQFNKSVMLTPEYANTWAYLRENKLYDSISDTIPNIESINLLRLSAAVEHNNLASKFFLSSIAGDSQLGYFFVDGKEKYTVNDQSKITDLLPKLQNARFTLGGGYIAEYKLKGRESYVTMFLPSADAPDYIKQNVK